MHGAWRLPVAQVAAGEVLHDDDSADDVARELRHADSLGKDSQHVIYLYNKTKDDMAPGFRFEAANTFIAVICSQTVSLLRNCSYVWPDICSLQHEISLLVRGSRVECVNFQGMDLGLQLQMAAKATLHITPHGGVAYSLLFSRPGSASIILIDSTCSKAKDIYILPNMPWLHVMYLHRAEEHLVHVHIMQAIVQASLRLGMKVPDFDFDAADPFLRRRLAVHAAIKDEAMRAQAAREFRETEQLKADSMQLALDVEQSIITATSAEDEGNGARVQLLVQRNANCAVFSNISIFCWGRLLVEEDPQVAPFWPVPIRTRGTYIGKMHLIQHTPIHSQQQDAVQPLLCGHHVDSNDVLDVERVANPKVMCIEIVPKLLRQEGTNTIAPLHELTRQNFAQIFSGINGFNYACFTLRDSGELQCIGINNNGQLGDGTLEFRSWLCPPHDMKRCAVPLPQPIIAVSLGSDHACAVAGEGAVYVYVKLHIRTRFTFFAAIAGARMPVRSWATVQT